MGDRHKFLILFSIYLALIGAPQFLGGAQAWGVALIVTLTAFFAGIAWLYQRGQPIKPVPRAFAWALLATFFWTTAQATALPCALLKFLAPASVESRQAALQLLERVPATWCTISLSPGGTYLEMLKGAALLAMFFAAWNWSAREGRNDVIRASALSSIVMALVALGHVLVGTDKVFGLYQPAHAHPHVLAPLMNDNHLAGLMAMGAPLTLALAIQQQNKPTRFLWMLGFLVLATTNFLCLSRGGLVAFVFGTVLLGVFRLTHRRHQWHLSSLGVIVGGTVAAVAILYYLTAHLLPAQWQQSSTGKLELSMLASRLVALHPLTGVGRGAFSQAFVQLEGTRSRHDFAENILVQWASEWGIPITSMLLIGLIWALWKALQRARSITQLAAIVAVVTLGLHNLVDFSSEMLGVSVIASALLAVALAPSSQQRSSRPPPALPYREFNSINSFTVAVCVLAAGIAWFKAEDWDRYRLERQLASLTSGPNTVNFERLLAQAVPLYPSEPAFALLASVHQLQHQLPKALAWLNRTMQLAPGWAYPHALAARYLYAAGHRDQALLEIREAARRDPRTVQTLACSIAEETQNAQWLLRASPHNQFRVLFLDQLAPCFGLDAQSPINDAILRAEPHHTSSRVRQATYALHQGQSATAIAILEQVTRDAPHHTGAYIVLCEAWLAAGHPEKALAVSLAADPVVDDKRALLRERADIHVALKDAKGLRQSLAELRGLHHDSPARVAEVWFLAGQLERKLGNLAHAWKAYEQAQLTRPHDRYLLAMARTAEQLGQMRKALSHYQALAKANPKYQKEVSRIYLRLSRQ